MFFVLALVQVNAADRVSLYEVSVPVADQSPEMREYAFKEGLSKVLYRVSMFGDGRSSESDSSEIELPKQLLAESGKYVESFSYSQNARFVNDDSKIASNGDGADEGNGVPNSVPNLGVEPEVLNSETEPAQAKVLSWPSDHLPYFVNIKFSVDDLELKLRELRLPLWGALRPSVLSWVVLQRGGERHLMTMEELEYSEVFEDRARSAGLPLFLPVGDLQDLASVDLNELWGLFPSSVDAASQRYPHDGVLLVRVYEALEGLELKWSYSDKANLYSGREKEQTYYALWQALNQSVRAALFPQYAVQFNGLDGEKNCIVRVSGVESFLHYASVLRHLESLSSVNKVKLQQVNGDRLVLEVSLHGAVQSFEQQVFLAGQMTQVSKPLGQARYEGAVAGVDAYQNDLLINGGAGVSELFFNWSSKLGTDR